MDSEKQSAKTIPPAWKVLHRRWTRPSGQFSFWTFLLVGIVILGGIAVWIELYRYAFIPLSSPSDIEAADAAGAHQPVRSLSALQLALATAGLAVAGPAVMQLLYSRDKLAIVAAVLLITVEMIFAMYLMVFGEAGKLGTLVAGLICVIVAILAWILANGEDDIFQDEVANDASTGGNPMRPLSSGQAPARV